LPQKPLAAQQHEQDGKGGVEFCFHDYVHFYP
jgi:hypothetical protein